jgi:hypothetical protein
MNQNALCDPQIASDAKTQVSVTCPGALLMGSTPGPLEHGKYCVDVSCPGRTRTYYVTRRSHRMQKHKFGVMCPCGIFIGSAPSPLKLENSAATFHPPPPTRTRMPYMIHIMHMMQKHKFGVTCPATHFTGSTPNPPDYEKWCVDVSRPRHNQTHYVSRRPHHMQKHKFNVTCPGTLFVGSAPNPAEQEKSAMAFCTTDEPKCTM